MEYKVDYHLHTYYSDGQMKPTELVKKMKKEDYDIISITDHDGIDGVNEAVIAGEAVEITVVPGVELSTEYDNSIPIHILGYKFDVENEELLEKLKELKDIRKKRNEKLLAALNSIGYELTLDEVKERPKQNYLGKPNFARAMVRKGYVQSVEDAFNEVFSLPKIAEIKKQKIDTIDAINLIKIAGGIPVLAHPGKIKGMGDKQSIEWKKSMEELICQLKKSGLKGLECFHPSHDEKDEAYFVSMAAKYHLHILQGSDFHGDK